MSVAGLPRSRRRTRQPRHGDQDLQARERFEDELILHLERDQFVAETSRPVPRAHLGARTTAALWALRVFACSSARWSSTPSSPSCTEQVPGPTPPHDPLPDARPHPPALIGGVGNAHPGIPGTAHL